MPLTLTRRIGESIRIGEDTVITVLRSSPTKCSLTIAAPDDVRIVRSEIATREPNNTPATKPAVATAAD